MSNLPVKIYAPNKSRLNIIKTFQLMWADLKQSKDLAYQLTKRDISAQYRQSYLGLLWVFIIPLVNSLTWIVLQLSGVIKLAETGIPYPVYVFAGTMLWQVFVEAITSPIQQVNMSKSILSKLNFPREAILLSGIYKVIFNSIIKIIILIPIVFYFGVYPDWKIVLLPLVVIATIILGFSIGLFLTPIGTLYTDISRVIPMAAQFLMFFSPVVYMIPESGVMRSFFEWNFMTPILMTFRDVISGGSLEYIIYFSIVIAIAIVLFIFSWIIFRVTMPVLIERMSA